MRIPVMWFRMTAVSLLLDCSEIATTADKFCVFIESDHLGIEDTMGVRHGCSEGSRMENAEITSAIEAKVRRVLTHTTGDPTHRPTQTIQSWLSF